MRFFTCFLLLSWTLTAKDPIEYVEWERTRQILHGREVKVWLKNGSKIKGDWVAVTADSFTIASGNKGTQIHSRADIQKLTARRRSAFWRVTGVTSMFMLANNLAREATGSAEAVQGPWAFAVLGGIVGGYLIGRSLDDH